MAFRALHRLAPPYLDQLVRVADLSGRRRLRSSSSSYQLHVPTYRLATTGRRSFPVAASILWNSLPPDIQSSASLSKDTSISSVLALDLEGVHDVKLHHPSSSVATSNQ